MRFSKYYFHLLLIIVLAISGCGDESKKKGMSLKGTLSFDQSARINNAPMLVAVINTFDYHVLQDNPKQAVIKYVVADNAGTSFNIDLTDTDLLPGDEIYLIAFIDNNYSGKVPVPDKGDVVGIYFEEGRLSPAFKLKAGENSGIHIDINREVFDYEASVSGTLLGNDVGEVILVAYAGEIGSSDFSAINVNDVIGYQTLTKGASFKEYKLDILPFGRNVPIENIQVFALLDVNGNEQIDGGDKVGFYSDGDEFSTLLTIQDATALTGIDIEFKFAVHVPCGVETSISGDFSLPAEYAATSPPAYIAIFDGTDPASVLDDPFSSIRYFSKIEGGTTTFSFNLTDTGLCPDDEVMVVGLWDKDFVAGFPNFTPGDFIGIYFEEGKLSPAFKLKAGENSGIHIDINREVFDYEASISGTLLGNDVGDVLLVAYAGEIESSDFSAINVNEVIGYQTLAKGASPQSYKLDILPYGKNVPIENIQVFALLDVNGNEQIDGGDKVGFYSNGDEFSTLLTIQDATALTGIDIEFKFAVHPPCGIATSLSGDFSLPTEYMAALPPAYIAIFDGTDPTSVLDDPFSSIRYFSKIEGGTTTFSFNLTDTGLCPDDEVMVVGLWDKDFVAGFPNFTPGDFIGIYFEEDRLSPAFKLKAGENSGIHIDIDREVFDYEASVSGTLLGNDVGNVILVAYTGEIESSDFSAININDVIGYQTLTKGASPQSYKLDILPYGKNVPIENVQVFALLDVNANEEIDGGDKIGFYSDGDEFSTLLTINDGTALTGIDIEFKFAMHEPCGVETSISGDFLLPSEYTATSPPSYIAIFDGADPTSVLNDPFSAIRYFKKIDGGTATFSFNLTDTGLCPDDEVMVIGLWDKDFVAGFPNFTPGDFIGIYFEEGRLSPAFKLKAGENSGIHIDINREVFDYEASISGTLMGNDAGDVILVAYAGEIESSDFSAINVNDVIGYQTLTKGASPQSYKLDILPYGKNVPIENVQVFALLDVNANEQIDGGDKIGFYSDGDEFSTLLTINGGTALTGIDIEFKFNVQESSGVDISITGTFSAPSGYFTDDAPVYITVFDSDDPGDILNDPYSVLKYFYKMPQGEFYFDCDLSHTDLRPGDSVIVAALWDRDFSGGFPDPNQGDKIGLVVNKETYQFTAELNYGRNIIPPEDFEFKINKNIYDFAANIDYALDLSDTGSFDMDRAKIIVLTIHVEGVHIGINLAGEIEIEFDIDYLLAVDILPATQYDYIGIGQRKDPKSPRQLPILTALYDQVVVYESNNPPQPLIKGVDHGEDTERTGYLVAILDKNGNGQLDREDEIGYYGEDLVEIIEGNPIIDLPCCIDIDIPDWFSGKLYLPTPIKRIMKGKNQEKRDDGSCGPYWIGNFIPAP